MTTSELPKNSNILHNWITMAGYPAIIVGNPQGHRCGYVQLPDSHPCVGKHYDDIAIEVHGGLTYGENRLFGFDCGHYEDAPDISIMSEDHRQLHEKFPSLLERGTIKTTEFCIVECEHMAAQFKQLES